MSGGFDVDGPLTVEVETPLGPMTAPCPKDIRSRDPQGNLGLDEAQVDVVVLELTPPSSFRGGQGQQASIGQGRDIVVPECAAGHFAPHAAHGHTEGGASQGGERGACGGHS